jgi:hypothetical protein
VTIETRRWATARWVIGGAGGVAWGRSRRTARWNRRLGRTPQDGVVGQMREEEVDRALPYHVTGHTIRGPIEWKRKIDS